MTGGESIQRSVQHVTKSEVVSGQGMAVAKHPLAAEAGLAVLQSGGNAMDAAVTMAFLLGVVEPVSSGIGGGGFLVSYDAAGGETTVVDYAMDAPLAVGPDTFSLDEGPGGPYGFRKVRDNANADGWKAASVPGMVRGLALALERFGTRPLKEVLGPAIEAAADGVAVDFPLAYQSVSRMPVLARFPASAATFLPDGFPLRAEDGERPAGILRQPELARTLAAIASDGPDAFYEGEIARTIAAEMRRNGGLISEEDLARYRPTVYAGGLVGHYRGCRIVGVPGATGSITALQGLAILDGYDLAGMSEVERLHLQAEAFRRAFADRYRYVGDPKQVPVPWDGLLSPEYAAELRAGIDPARAAAVVTPGDPWAYEPARHEQPGSPVALSDTSTTHLSVVDAAGNAVSLTQTLVSHFGSGVTVPGTGVVLNNAMSWFDPEPGRINALAPGRRGLNNMTPLIVLRDGRPILTVGGAGGRKIIQAAAQVVMRVLDDGLGPQEAVGAPRIDSSGQHLLANARFAPETVAALEAMGHRVRVARKTFSSNPFSVQLAIAIDAEGRRHGGVDPEHVAIAAGY